jgi:hypothetical protein
MACPQRCHLDASFERVENVGGDAGGGLGEGVIPTNRRFMRRKRGAARGRASAMHPVSSTCHA